MTTHMRLRARSATGFTLVEVLVAMMIMSVIAIMSWQGVDGIVRTRTASEQKLEQMLRLNTVLAQWEQDLTSVQDSYQVPALQFDGISARVTRRTPEGLQMVVWSLRGDKLLRWAGPRVTETSALKDSWIGTQQLMGTEPAQLRTLSGISQWQLYCFRGNAWSNCQSSGDVVAQPPASGSPTPREEPPDGIRLVLSFADGSGFSGSVTRDVSIGP